MRRLGLTLTVLTCLLASQFAPALARGNDLTIKSGFGEELTIENGFFGRKKRKVKDRMGNSVEHDTGLFGTKQTSVNALGNSFSRKKGLFGGSQIEGSTILGDKVTTKKGLFGRRKTTVDLSGVSGAIQGLVRSQSAPKAPGNLPGYGGASGSPSSDPGSLMPDPSSVPGMPTE